ncbi:hypothetical protein [Porphyromonas sp.]|uniref:THUMP-like domain-containing protein n=1 Tax=Porphyromonas sp. TaxID=1924944 RepID=UPI0026DAAA8C|nr:hypothetical protein [Porphyromonas sp.]MDO4695673.1 hypothetical protein [Porphyromonas sp.]MDO4771660.1 hypothetical protein [Porphyromonas sp.]
MFDKSLIDFVHRHADADIIQLILHKDKYPDIDVRQAVKCIEGLRKLQKKLPLWAKHRDVMVPDPVMVEQASSYETALYKTRFVPSHNSVILDMSGGLGIDTSLFSSVTVNKTHYLEKDPDRAHLASHNFSILGLSNIETHVGVAEEEGIDLIKRYLPELIFIDPDRRAQDKKRSFFIEDSTPNIRELIPKITSIHPSCHILIKLSPMIDISYLKEAIKTNFDIHVVSSDRECKELLVHIRSNDSKKQQKIFAIELFKTSTFYLQTTPNKGEKPIYKDQLGKFIYDLYPSVAKIGLEYFFNFSSQVSQVHPNTHLYFSDRFIESFPGRKFEVISSFAWGKKAIKELKEKEFNVIVKNLNTSPEKVIKDFKIKEGGEDYLFCFSMGNTTQKQLIIARRLG